MRPQDLSLLLRAYAVRRKTPVFDFREFLRSMPPQEGSRAEAEAALAEISGRGIVVSGNDIVIPDFPVRGPGGGIPADHRGAVESVSPAVDRRRSPSPRQS